MKYKSLELIHNKEMQDPEYREVYEAEEASERFQETLCVWRNKAGLASAQVAERMGVKPPTVSRMKKNATKMK